MKKSYALILVLIAIGTGFIERRNPYEDDRPYGVSVEYYKSGNLKRETVYKKQYKLVKDYSEDGKLKWEWTFKDGKVKRVKRYNKNGNLQNEWSY